MVMVNMEAPGDLNVGSKKNQKILKSLEEHTGMARLVGYVSGECESCWNPHALVINPRLL
jgi:hypothetical protein